MAVDGDLGEIFLDTRVKRLKKCFSPATGWRHCLVSLEVFLGEQRTVTCQYQGDCLQNVGTKVAETSFVRSKLHQIFDTLRNCFRLIMSQVPRAVLLEKNYKNIVLLMEMLKDFSKLLGRKIVGNDEAGKSEFTQHLMQSKARILDVSRTLLRELKLPVTRSDFRIKKFCLGSAPFVFCTVSGSAKLNNQKMDLLLIDEAAQLKECESLIPMQLSGLKHAVLIGDECQLPATVKSKVRSVLTYVRALSHLSGQCS